MLGLPDWTRAERFDVSAKADGDFPSLPRPPAFAGPPHPVFQMLRGLLADRFKLVSHTEQRGFPIYALVVARTDGALGPQLTASTSDCPLNANTPLLPIAPDVRPKCGMVASIGRLLAGAQPISQLIHAIQGSVDRVIIDRTKLTGTFDFSLEFLPDFLQERALANPNQPLRLNLNGVNIDPNRPSLTAALQEQLGLKLESTKGPVEVLVIDHVERPTPD